MKLTGVKENNPLSFSIIYQYFMDYVYSACHPYLLVSVLFQKLLIYLRCMDSTESV